MKNTVSLKVPTAGQLPRIGSGRIWLAGVAATLLATIINIGIGLVATLLFSVPAEFEPLQNWAIGFTTIFVGFGATSVFAGLNRFVSKPRKLFLVVSAIVLFLSVLPLIPLLLIEPKYDPGTNLQTISTLFLIHLTTAGICVGLLLGLTRKK
jgi:hypothetical protein